MGLRGKVVMPERMVRMVSKKFAKKFLESVRRVKERVNQWILQKVQEEWSASLLGGMERGLQITPIPKRILLFRIRRIDWSRKSCLFAIELEIEDILAAIERLQPEPLPVPLLLIPTSLRIPAPRIEVLQPLVGRAPPLCDVFCPIPKTELGSCARSDLPADSAY